MVSAKKLEELRPQQLFWMGKSAGEHDKLPLMITRKFGCGKEDLVSTSKLLEAGCTHIREGMAHNQHGTVLESTPAVFCYAKHDVWMHLFATLTDYHVAVISGWITPHGTVKKPIAGEK